MFDILFPSIFWICVIAWPIFGDCRRLHEAVLLLALDSCSVRHGGPDPACLTGNGDITEVTAEVCRTNPFNNYHDLAEGTETPCLFLFTLNGESHDTCIMDEIEDFTRPVFRYLIRTLKGAGPNGIEYTDTHLTAGNELQGLLTDCSRNLSW